MLPFPKEKAESKLNPEVVDTGLFEVPDDKFDQGKVPKLGVVEAVKGDMLSPADGGTSGNSNVLVLKPLLDIPSTELVGLAIKPAPKKH